VEISIYLDNAVFRGDVEVIFKKAIYWDFPLEILWVGDQLLETGPDHYVLFRNSFCGLGGVVLDEVSLLLIVVAGRHLLDLFNGS
jgi:hypothetical protein